MKESKQNKILNKIHYDDGQSKTKLKEAQKAKDDEFYTPLADITNELEHWKDKFANKNIYCPCDWDILPEEPDVVGIHIEMDSERSERDIKFGIRRIKKCFLIKYKGTDFVAGNGKFDFVNKYNNEEITEKEFLKSLFKDGIEDTRLQSLIFEEVDPNTARRVTCNFIKYLITTDCKSITASGYDTINDRGIKFQEIDYSKYDMVVTNPPFSLYNEFMKIMLTTKEKNPDFNFILLAPFLNRVTPNIGLPLMLKKIYLGYGRKLSINFVNPNGTNKYKYKLVSCDWITSFSDAQDIIDNTRLVNNIKYYESTDSADYGDEYDEVENITMKNGTHPIKITNFRSIPDDYNGWMFCAIGVLDILSNKEFEWYGTNFKGYYNKVNPEANPFNHKATDEMVSYNGKQLFHGVVIRRRTTENGNMKDIFEANELNK